MRRLPILLVVLAVAVPGLVQAAIPETVPDLPVAGAQVAKGTLVTKAEASVTPTPKVVDGDVSDWTGEITRLGGTAIYSHGEYVYQDYLMDDWGADDGQDADRVAYTDTLANAEARTYRIEALSQAAGDQFDAPPPAGSLIRYGDAAYPAGFKDEADIEEVRVAADDEYVYFLVRTTGMQKDRTGVLILIDTEPGGSWSAPGGITTAAEWRILASSTGRFMRHRNNVLLDPCSDVCSPDVAVDAGGYTNAIEVRFLRSRLYSYSPEMIVGVATGVVNETGTDFAVTRPAGAKSDLFNVAFRPNEPQRIWMDHDQAFALRDGNIDPFFTTIQLGKLTGGATESFTPKPGGYFERVYVSDSPVNREVEDNGYFQGAFQHYGLYLPSSYRHTGTQSRATWWTHYRGGHAHDAAAWVPGLLRQLGEQVDNVVITPSARGTSSWYVGRGHEDFLDVWDDSTASFNIDPRGISLSGYSMGGFASYLLGLLYPDRWASAFPTSGPPTQGLWAGVGPPMSPQNGGDAEAEFTYNILENARNLPYVIYHGTNDELVPSPGVTMVAEKLRSLGYRYRYYLFPGYEHYSHAIVDEWGDAARYMNTFTRPAIPQRVTYRAWPALERAVETVSTPAGVTLDYDFDGAYWVDGLEVATPGVAVGNWGTIDAQTLALADAHQAIPEAGTTAAEVAVPPAVGTQHTPFVMTGQAWLPLPSAQVVTNRFLATLQNLSSATLDTQAMALSILDVVTASVSTDSPATLKLTGDWSPTVTVAGAAGYSVSGSTLTITLPAGTHELTITP